jgi:hypothetical protein
MRQLQSLIIAAGVGAMTVLYIMATRTARNRARQELEDHYMKEGYDAIEARQLANSISDSSLRNELRERGWLRED